MSAGVLDRSRDFARVYRAHCEGDPTAHVFSAAAVLHDFADELSVNVECRRRSFVPAGLESERERYEALSDVCKN